MSWNAEALICQGDQVRGNKGGGYVARDDAGMPDVREHYGVC